MIYLKNECRFCAFFVRKKGGGLVEKLSERRKAHYCQNGLWRSTGKIMRVLEQNDERVKFETDTVCYCINFYEEGTGVVALAA